MGKITCYDQRRNARPLSGMWKFVVTEFLFMKICFIFFAAFKDHVYPEQETSLHSCIKCKVKYNNTERDKRDIKYFARPLKKCIDI